MRNVLIVDVETTGLDPATDRVIEVGMIEYSITHQSVIQSYSILLHAEDNQCEALNRIPAALLREAKCQRSPTEIIQRPASECDAIIAHHAEFDRQWFAPEIGPWLCTMSDFKWPRATKDGQSLVHLALEHGIGVSSAHRALTDCQLIAALFDRMTDLTGMFAHAMRPKALFRAMVSYDERELAKASGFKWDGEAKTWTRRMAIEDAAALPFKTVNMGTR